LINLRSIADLAIFKRCIFIFILIFILTFIF
jgi:hypothetical protein